MALLIGGLLLALDAWAAWKGVNRNRGMVEQQPADPRRPFSN